MVEMSFYEIYLLGLCLLWVNLNSSVFLLENVAIEYVNTPKYTLFSADFYLKSLRGRHSLST